MKNNIVLIVILAIVWPTLLGNSVAQTITEMPQEADTIEGWKASDMEYLREHQGDFVQKRMDFLFEVLQRKGIKIASVSSGDSSPYKDPRKKGRSYIRKFYLWSKDLENLKKGDIYQELVVTLDLEENDTTLRSPTFWRSFDPDKFEVEQFVQKTKDLPIRSIEIRTDTIIGRKM